MTELDDQPLADRLHAGQLDAPQSTLEVARARRRLTDASLGLVYCYIGFFLSFGLLAFADGVGPGATRVRRLLAFFSLCLGTGCLLCLPLIAAVVAVRCYRLARRLGDHPVIATVEALMSIFTFWVVGFLIPIGLCVAADRHLKERGVYDSAKGSWLRGVDPDRIEQPAAAERSPESDTRAAPIS